MKSTHCSTSRGANRGPNFVSNWTVSSKRWPNIPGKRWGKRYFLGRIKNCSHDNLFSGNNQTIRISSVWETKQVVSNPVWRSLNYLSLRTVTWWLAATVAAHCQYAVIMVVHRAGTTQALIHPKTTFHQVHPFRFRHLTPRRVQSCSPRWGHGTNELQRLMKATRQTAANGGQCAVNNMVCVLATDLFWTENWATDTLCHWTQEGGRACRHEVRPCIIPVWKSWICCSFPPLNKRLNRV